MTQNDVVSTERLAQWRHKCAGSGFHDHDGCACTNAELHRRFGALSRRSTDGEAVAWMHILGAIWRADNCPAGMDFTDEGWVPLYTHPTPTEPVAAPSGPVVDDAMVERFKASFIAETGSTMWPTDGQFRSILTAALSIEVSL